MTEMAVMATIATGIIMASHPSAVIAGKARQLGGGWAIIPDIPAMPQNMLEEYHVRSLRN